MSQINLLPWREQARERRSKRLTALAVGSWVVAGLLVLGAYNYMEMRKSQQNSRNGFLRTEIAALEDEIREIEKLRARRDSLISRMEIIQGLQRNRTELVQIMDDLVHLIPEGVYLTRVTKRDESMVIEGRAQSNARVSSLMSNLEDSQWFHGPRLDVINVSEDSAGRISAFTLQVSRAGRAPADADRQSG